MSRQLRVAPILAILAIVVCVGLRHALEAAPQKEPPSQEAQNEEDVRKFMRGKLTASQQVLEGLVTEDYQQIEKAAARLKLMSLKADWNVIQGLEYAEQSKAFRRAAELLKKMADEKNVDGSSLAYLQVTMSCVNCHKWTKGADVAFDLQLPTGRQMAQR